MSEYTREEMQTMLEAMREANQKFYWMAMRTGCHGFIEFCGLQSKYIDLCQEAMKQGVEFPFLNTHSPKTMPMPKHHFDYLIEKLDCIYGPMLRGTPGSKEILVQALYGDDGG